MCIGRDVFFFFESEVSGGLFVTFYSLSILEDMGCAKAVYFCHVSSFFCSTPLLIHEGSLLPKNGVRHSSLWKGTRLEKGMY